MGHLARVLFSGLANFLTTERMSLLEQKDSPPADMGEDASLTAPRKLTDLGAAVLLLGAVFLVYGHALHAPFIFDDRVSIVENPSIRSTWPLWGTDERPGPLRSPHDVSTAGRPLVNFTFALNYRVGRLDPTSYHGPERRGSCLGSTAAVRLVRQTLLLEFFSGRFSCAADPLAFAAVTAVGCSSFANRNGGI